MISYVQKNAEETIGKQLNLSLMGTKVIYEIQLLIVSTTNIQKMKFQTYNLKLQQKVKVTRNKSN